MCNECFRFYQQDAFTKNPQLTNLLLDPYFCERISGSQQSLRQVVAQTALVGVPAPAFSAALAFYDGYRSAVLPANMLQVRILIKTKIIKILL